MTFRVSEKRLFTAILLFAAGIYLAVSNAVNFSSKLISEKSLLLELLGICLAVLGTIRLCKAFKK